MDRPPARIRALQAIACALFVALAVFGLEYRCFAASAPGHLYVSRHVGSSGQQTWVIDRFPLVNGFPAKRADKSYPGYGSQIAVAANGTIYMPAGNGITPVHIYAIDPGNDKADREITIPNTARRCENPGRTTVDSIATDANGYLFAAVDNYFSGIGPRLHRSRRSLDKGTGLPCQGVAIFSPSASGSASPVQAISLTTTYMPTQTVDAADNLYVADTGSGEILEYSNAVNAPQFARELGSLYTYVAYSLATDSSANLYVYDAPECRTCNDGAINVFPPSASGQDPPSSSITLEGMKFNDFGGIAQGGGYIYATNLALRRIDMYHVTDNGKVKPFFHRRMSDLATIAVGP